MLLYRAYARGSALIWSISYGHIVFDARAPLFDASGAFSIVGLDALLGDFHRFGDVFHVLQK